MPILDEVIDNYHDILLVIELEVAKVYQAHPDLNDHHVDKVYEALQRAFEKELRGKNPPTFRWLVFEEELYAGILAHCRTILDPEAELIVSKTHVQTASRETLIKCLKRLRKSIKTWSPYGNRGYLEYIMDFLDHIE